MTKKLGRNDPCSCGSGKKFKKCCESTLIGKKYRAHKIDPPPKTTNLTSLFHSNISTAKPEDIQKPIQITEKTKETTPPETESPPPTTEKPENS